MCTTQGAKRFYPLLFQLFLIQRRICYGRPWLLPLPICTCCHLRNWFCIYTHSNAAIKSVSGKTTRKTNLTSLPEFDGRAGEPGDKASWLVEVLHLFCIDTTIIPWRHQLVTKLVHIHHKQEMTRDNYNNNVIIRHIPPSPFPQNPQGDHPVFLRMF